MMDALRQWLIGVTGAAMLVAVADSLTPAGTVKKIGRLVGGLVLLLAIVNPLIQLDYSVLAMATDTYQSVAEEMDQALEETNLDLMKTIIAEETGAYILDKAALLGASCTRVVVTCELGAGDLPYPSAVVVTGSMTPDQRADLSRAIALDLAIPESCQSFEREEQTG